MLPNSQAQTPTTRVTSQSVVPRDITEKFTQAASRLKTGQLVKDEYFTLFEAVGALEIMDSKMDSGYLGPEEDEQTLDDDYDVLRDLTPEQVVGIMDELLCHEMAWHMGHPLSQTLFTSLYLDKLLWPVPRIFEDTHFGRGRGPGEEAGSELVHIVLRSYCLGLVKCCDFVHTRVTAEFFYEEEDFSTQLYNRSLLSHFEYGLFCNLLDRAISWIDDQPTVDETVKNAIRARLEFRLKFLLGLQQDINIMQTRSVDHFEACLSLLPTLQQSSRAGQPVSEAFSWKIQRKLASTVPPRPMVTISLEDALAHLKRLFQDGIHLSQVLDYQGPYNLRVAIWTFLSRKPQPLVYIRSLTQTIIMNKSIILGTIPVKQFLYDELASLVLPSSILLEANLDETEMPSDPRFQIAQLMDGFVRRFSQPFVDTFRSACLNRCRIRRTVCHTIVDWDNLQMEAEDLDEQLRVLSGEPPLELPNGDTTYAYPLSSWTYHQKLIQFRLILQLGFELSIYAPEELPGMYWYLSHICSTHLGHIDRIRTFIVSAAQRSRLSSAKRALLRKSFLLFDRLTTQIIAIDAFAISLHALYVLLSRHKILPTASSPQAYSNDKFRYELRMKPFLSITLPELVPYDEYYREATLQGDSDEIVLERATKAIGEARKAWEATLANGPFLEDPDGEKLAAPALAEDWTRDVKDTMRACIGASIAIESVKKAILARGSPTQDTETLPPLNLKANIPEAGEKGRWHDWWVVPQVLQVQAQPKAKN
ncbi:Putative Amino-acid N-acetyltransferase subunit Mak10 [Aspergillus calidoustus]|uniref:Putative Amino-acid N-acetyltransferase subunit Mak10 n=1 Tax=Aspergillus calidoustus TaxID=454130 RepID=A0A0U5FS84_ASPCI|nr:Putative Amino-acid N-acetyltransferase subunit Mak10 [Aspergillus calidoustus]